MRTLPELRDVNSDQQNQGLAANLVIDRDTASRLGITASALDSVLYDAFGQREVSTMYTALNQYFVVMEVDPQYQTQPRLAERHLHQGQQRGGRNNRHAGHGDADHRSHRHYRSPRRSTRRSRDSRPADDADRGDNPYGDLDDNQRSPDQHHGCAAHRANTFDHFRACVHRHRLRDQFTHGGNRRWDCHCRGRRSHSVHWRGHGAAVGYRRGTS